MPVVALLSGFFIPIKFFESYTIVAMALMGVVNFILTFFLFSIHKQDEGDAIKGFFTPNNWNSKLKTK